MLSTNLKLPPIISRRQSAAGAQTVSNQNFSNRETSKSLALAAARAKRKEIEESEHQLNNRVMALEHEQEKIIKATKDTKEKTSLMLKHRVVREETQQKMREMTQRMKELAQQSYLEKRRKVNEVQQNRQEIDSMRNKLMELLRGQKALTRKRLQENKERMQAENKLKREKVKHMKQVVGQQVASFFNMRFDHFSRERDMLIQEEERRFRDKEAVVKSLSGREDKLLNDIDQHQMIFKEAQNQYEDLTEFDTESFVAKHSDYLHVISPNKNLNKSLLSTKSITSTHRNRKPLSFEKNVLSNRILESRAEYEDFEQYNNKKLGQNRSEQQNSAENYVAQQKSQKDV